MALKMARRWATWGPEGGGEGRVEVGREDYLKTKGRAGKDEGFSSLHCTDSFSSFLFNERPKLLFHFLVFSSLNFKKKLLV